MSAFLCNAYHINALANWAAMPRERFSYFWNGERHFPTDAHTIAQILHGQNLRSVNARYNEDNDVDIERDRFAPDITPVQVIKAVNCLQYQSCETDDWPETEAYAICQAIIDRAIRHLPGYEAAERELTDPGRRAVSITDMLK